jgi:hypothetical protein
LADVGIAAVHVGELGMAAATDDTILAVAASNSTPAAVCHWVRQ